MRHSTSLFFLCLVMAGVYVFLFHGAGTGVNLLLFDLFALVALWRTRRVVQGPLARLALGGALLTALMVVVHASLFTAVMNLISTGLAIGILLAPEAKALHRSAAIACTHLTAVPLAILRAIPFPSQNASRPITPRGVLSVSLVPVVLLLFVAIYRASNPHFDQFIAAVLLKLDRIDFLMVQSFLIGLLISGFLLLSTKNHLLPRLSKPGEDQLRPLLEGSTDPRSNGELLTATLLLAGLNVLLLIANILDIKYVWAGFHFDGQYLKQFVHEGTYLLLLSILLGAGIVLYYFRGDLNFHRRSGTIKLLSYAWLGQNMVLALSVGMRNYWYIHHYALAYKRIGVGFFLLTLCIGLALVMIKVHKGRTDHFLMRTNALAIYCVALLMALFNWDGIIARYNMGHGERAFVHLDYLASLSDKALPYLVRPPRDLERIAAYNATMIGGTERYTRELYMAPEEYAKVIDQRVRHFVATYPGRSWKEWNLADARAYSTLLAVTEK